MQSLFTRPVWGRSGSCTKNLQLHHYMSKSKRNTEHRAHADARKKALEQQKLQAKQAGLRHR